MAHPASCPPLLAPSQVLSHFRSTYSRATAAEALRHLFLLALAGGLLDLQPPHTQNLHAFYENLEKVVTALYALPDAAAPAATEGGDHA